ncbi:MAG: hypothetical protein K8L99_09230 [Anaerolineae bacterium]|nr:hypothetical protein [Anaerolineae bacterium]
MIRFWLVCGMLFAVAGITAAQDEGLAVEDVELTTQVDALGLEVQMVQGRLVNDSSSAFDQIDLYAEAYDGDDQLIGEGFGYLVNACGEALLPGFTMHPGMSEGFAVPLDIFEEGAAVARVEVIPEASAVDTASSGQSGFFPGVNEVTRREVVSVEWIDANSLRYSVGCWRDLFSQRQWHEYNLRTGIQQPVEHPRAAEMTDALANALELDDDMLFERSFFTFAPDQRRGVYQTELNTLVTVEPDGTFPRVLYDRLYNISLQGIYFPTGGAGVFIAYYYGGLGDPVNYVTGNVNGQQLSQSPKDPANPTAINESLTSLITPGVSTSGKRVVVMREVDGTSAYYLRATDTERIDRLFEAEPPGNNWPAPLYTITPENEQFVYVVRPVDEDARLQCYNVLTQSLHDLSGLPLALSDSARSWMWLSPDGESIALAANGVSGGLWLIDLTALEDCA